MDQTCRNEHQTRENRTPALRLRFRLEHISHIWELRRIRAHNRRIQLRNEARRQFHTFKMAVKHKVRTWRRDVHELALKLEALDKGWRADNNSVTPEDWAKLVNGQDRKMAVILGRKYPQNKWPKNVPYLNMIALMQWRKKKRNAAERKAEAVQEPTVRKPRSSQKTVQRISLPIRSSGVVPTSWSTTPTPTNLSVEEQIRTLEFSVAKSEQQIECLRRSRIYGPQVVDYDQWLKAVEGTDALQTDEKIRGLVELARRRKMGEKCDGWAFGMYYGAM